MSNYEILKACGFSPMKALEIAFDISRNSFYARGYLELALKSVQAEAETARAAIEKATKP